MLTTDERIKLDMDNTRQLFETIKHTIPKGYKLEIVDGVALQYLHVNDVSVCALVNDGRANIARIKGVIDSLRALGEINKTIEPDPAKIVVFLSGGLIGEVVSDQPIKEVVIIDDDVEGREDIDVTTWKEGDTTLEGYFYSGSFSHDPDEVNKMYELYNKD